MPGQRLDQLEASIVDGLNFDLLETRAALLGRYDHPIFADLPADTSIEGYIYPETYQINSQTTVEDLLNASFEQLSDVFTEELQEKIAARGLDIHEAITLASIIEKESSNVEDQPTIAQVFLKRLDEGIMLGSDVTFIYAAAISGRAATPSLDSPYNTRIVGGLPPGPISNFTASALEAIAEPADSDYLYFVAGDDGITYFSNTLAEHESLTAQHCIELCKLP